jgi:hypothetical protein
MRITGLADVVFAFVGVVILGSLSMPLIDGRVTGRDNLPYANSLAALLFSWIGLYLATLRPFFMRPRLGLLKGVQRSDPTEDEKRQGWKSSWFISKKQKTL